MSLIDEKLTQRVEAADASKRILHAYGYDSESDDLKDTPRRFAKFLQEFFNPPEFNFTVFKSPTDEMVIVKDIPFYSLCEHHLVPFFGKAHVAYIPKGKMVGLSKIPRTVDMFARRLQNQERITFQIAKYLEEKLKPVGVGVILEARHLCIEMRGVEKPGTQTSTSTMLGAFKTDVNCRQEFLKLLK